MDMSLERATHLLPRLAAQCLRGHLPFCTDVEPGCVDSSQQHREAGKVCPKVHGRRTWG